MARRREAADRRPPAAAPGGEGQPGAAASEPRAPKLRQRSERLQRGADPAPPVARVAIPTAAGRHRPRGPPPRAATRVQRAPGAGRHAGAAPACLGVASGARPGRRPPPAWEAGTGGRDKRHLPWGRAAALRRVSEAREHAGRVPGVAPRRGDPRVVRPSRQGLQAGGRAEGPGRPPAAGTPPGGRARPLVATRSRPAVGARGAAPWRRRQARGEVSRVRAGDDGRVGCQPTDAAAPGRSALRERCQRCRRARPPEQTRRRACGRGASARRQRRGPGPPETCDGRGVPPRCGPTTRGQGTGRRWPSATRRRTPLQEVQQTRRERRHWPSAQRGAGLPRGVGGPSRSAGGPRPMGRLRVVRAGRRRSWCRIVRRRRQRQRLPWQRRYRRAPQWRPAPPIRPPYPAQRRRVTTRGRSPVRECRTPGSVRGGLGNWHPYRDPLKFRGFPLCCMGGVDHG